MDFSLLLMEALDVGPSPGCGGLPKLLFSLALSRARRYAGGMPSRTRAASSDTVLYTLMTLRAISRWALTRCVTVRADVRTVSPRQGLRIVVDFRPQRQTVFASIGQFPEIGH